MLAEIFDIQIDDDALYLCSHEGVGYILVALLMINATQFQKHEVTDPLPALSKAKVPGFRLLPGDDMKSHMIAKAPPLREQIVKALLEELRSGRFQPGERLTENGLGERLGVSRTPVREALNQLVEQGLIEARPRGGYLVPSPSIDEVRDIIAVRRMIEPPAMRLVARHATAHDIRRVDEALAMEDKHLADTDGNKFTRANENFRTSLFDGLANKTLRAVIEQFSGHLNFIRATTLHDIELRKVIVTMQRQIRDAVAANDENLAETQWQRYLQHSEETLIATLYRLSGTQI